MVLKFLEKIHGERSNENRNQVAYSVLTYDSTNVDNAFLNLNPFHNNYERAKLLQSPHKSVESDLENLPSNCAFRTYGPDVRCNKYLLRVSQHFTLLIFRRVKICSPQIEKIWPIPSAINVKQTIDNLALANGCERRNLVYTIEVLSFSESEFVVKEVILQYGTLLIRPALPSFPFMSTQLGVDVCNILALSPWIISILKFQSCWKAVWYVF